jgi:hypothetical protein
MDNNGKTSEIIRVKDREMLLIDGYIAVRIDTLRELFSRPFNKWMKEQRAEQAAQKKKL